MEREGLRELPETETKNQKELRLNVFECLYELFQLNLRFPLGCCSLATLDLHAFASQLRSPCSQGACLTFSDLGVECGRSEPLPSQS